MSNENLAPEIVSKAPTEKTSIGVTGLSTAERPPLEPAGFRILLVSFLAAGIGLIAGCIAFLLYKLIGLFTNLAFYGHFSTMFVSARHNHLGWW
jgi:chloride channel protein, CIC family